MAKAKQSRKAGKDHRTPTIEPSTSNGNGNGNGRISESAALAGIREFNLLLDEVEGLEVRELFKIYFWKQAHQQKRPSDAVLRRTLEMAVRLLQPRQHPTIRESAILAYAKTRLTQLDE